MCNSNFYGLVRNLIPNVKELFSSIFQDSIYVRPTTIQTARAANLTCAAFRYRTELDHENIKPVCLKARKKKLHIYFS
jgi:hypothetical protein